MQFDDAFAYVVGEEGGYSTDKTDPGNWTGGKVGVGTLKGTKYGISAAEYPDLDIANLTVDDAKAIYKRDYWDRIRGDEVPSGLGLGLFDCAVNQGVHEAIVLLQQSLGVQPDGVFGSGTMSALNEDGGAHIAREFTVLRILQYSRDSSYYIDGKGWIRRAIDTYTKMIT